MRFLGGGDMFDVCDVCESDLRFLCACAVEFETAILFCVFRFSFWAGLWTSRAFSARASYGWGSLVKFSAFMQVR